MSYTFLSFRAPHEQSIDQWSSRSLEKELESFINQTITNVFQKYLGGSNGKLLEGGCGYGAWCVWFKRRGHEVIGIENDERVVAKAKKYSPLIPIEVGDVVSLSYPDNSFDAYISLGVLEHFEQGPDRALAEAHRVLKPGGLAFISVPVLTVVRWMITHPFRNLYFFWRKLRGKKNYFWEYRYSEKELKKYIEDNHFEVIETDIDDYDLSVSNRHIGLWSDWFFLRKKGGDIWELNFIGKMVRFFLRIFPHRWYCSAIVMVARAKK